MGIDDHPVNDRFQEMSRGSIQCRTNDAINNRPKSARQNLFPQFRVASFRTRESKGGKDDKRAKTLTLPPSFLRIEKYARRFPNGYFRLAIDLCSVELYDIRLAVLPSASLNNSN
jgi:hypothetical protein